MAVICRLLCSSCWVAPDRTQVVTDLGLYHPGNPRACAPSGQLLTMSEHHHPARAQLIFHGGPRLMASGYSQSLQLTGLGKSLLLTCQQQSRLNYKRRVYSTHTEGILQVFSLGNKGGCATTPIGHLLHYAMLPSQRVRAALPNT